MTKYRQHDYLEFEPLAIELKYKVDKTRTDYNGYTFIKGEVHIWKCSWYVGGERVVGWNVKRLQGGHYTMVDQKHFTDLEKALIYGASLTD